MRALVIGAGAAGTAAAWKLARDGAAVTVVSAWSGASALYSGAVDLQPWERGCDTSALETEVALFVTALGLFRVGPDHARIATSAGVIRNARGTDAALLDLQPLAGKTIGVVDARQPDWDAQLLARQYDAQPWAMATRTRFVPVAAPELYAGRGLSSHPYDFAIQHDSDGFSERLARQLAPLTSDCDALLTGPWLGLRGATCERLRERLGKAIGEITSPPGGVAGARFEVARDELLQAAGIAVVRDVVSAVKVSGAGCLVELRSGEPCGADVVVLASGGVTAGGVRMAQPAPSSGQGPGFELSYAAPVELELDGQKCGRSSSLYGLDLQALGMDVLRRIGIATDGPRALGSPYVFVAGDARAGGVHTVLHAASSGIAAARAAQRSHAGTG